VPRPSLEEEEEEEELFRGSAEIGPGLHVSSDPAPENAFEVRLPANVEGLRNVGVRPDVVVSFIPTSSHVLNRDQMLIVWPIKDGPVPVPQVACSLAALVASQLRAGHRVLLHCSAGMNRSVLIAALVLMEQGMTADQAIARVRERRSGSLSDEYADWLRSLSKRPVGINPRVPTDA
jgi:protein-tyrosine phosphatase